MSVLSRLARAASEYIKNRAATAGRTRSRSAPPPPRPPSTPPPLPSGGDDGDDDEFDDIQVLGRDASYDRDQLEYINSRMTVVSSSNVYAYGFEQESASMGILYVTFLDYDPNAKQKTNGPGSTYAYYNFPLLKYKQFQQMAASTAGGAVWDYCRVRHSVYEHQHTYRLIQVHGEYVPRKATRKGFQSRSVPVPGIGERGFVRSTLAPRSFGKKGQPTIARRQLPNRNYAALPNRAAPNRGEPNRGR